MRWQKKITKKELKHVRKNVGNTLTEFKAMVVIHENIRSSKESHINPCYDCQTIARKLGLIK